MIVIGFRASPSEVYYSIAERADETISILSVEEIRIPISLNFPEKLNFVRKTIKDIIFEYQITRAGIRTTESTAQRFNIERVSIEAIIQEVLSRSPIEKYFVGQISNISSKLGIPRTDFKKIIEEKKSHHHDIDLSDYNNKEKESILVAIASLNI